MEGKAAGVIESLIQITIKAIGDGDIAAYRPILVDYDKQVVSVLADIPEDIDHRDAVRDWLRERDLKTYGVAFQRGGALYLAVISPTGRQFATLSRVDGAWQSFEADDLL